MGILLHVPLDVHGRQTIGPLLLALSNVHMFIEDPLGLLDLFLFIVSHAVDLIVLVLLGPHLGALIVSPLADFAAC